MRKESLLVLNQTINYRVRVSDRAQRMRIAVYADGDVIVTKPKGTKPETFKRFIEAKKFWIHKKLEATTTIPIPELKKSGMRHFNKHKDEALGLAEAKVKQWNEGFNYRYEQISVKQLKSRWGSCTKNNNLCFNYKILFLPEELQDYVIVHELCHTRRKDHSKFFWATVAGSLPDYDKLRLKMRILI